MAYVIFKIMGAKAPVLNRPLLWTPLEFDMFHNKLNTTELGNENLFLAQRIQHPIPKLNFYEFLNQSDCI